MRRTVAVLFLVSCGMFGQSPCEVPRPDLGAKVTTIFSPEQEEMLGDVIADAIQQRVKVHPQAGLAGPLERIGARLLQYLPDNPYHFRFFLIEIPQANAFSVVGGRIYVSRRLIAFAENEDELAGVIAHSASPCSSLSRSAPPERRFAESSS